MRAARILEEECLTKLTREQLACELDISLPTLDRILAGVSISPQAALALGRYFDTDPRDWLLLQ